MQRGLCELKFRFPNPKQELMPTVEWKSSSFVMGWGRGALRACLSFATPVQMSKYPPFIAGYVACCILLHVTLKLTA